MCQKKKVWAMLKKEKRENIHAKEHERKREKNACQRARRKEKKKKERNKDSPYFQIKAFIQKRERVMIQSSTKNI